MFHVVTLLFLLVAPKLIISITILPDVGLRNVTKPIGNKTINDLKLNSLTDRNRRLIPYMTFYIPQNEYPINQDYIPNPQQQQQQQQHSEEQHTNAGHHQSQSSENEQNQMINIYQSSPSPPLNRLQQQPQNNHHQQQHHYPESIIENHFHSSSLSNSEGDSGQSTGGPTFIPLNFHNHRGQEIYKQILYQDHGRNQFPLIKLKGNIPFNQLQQHHHLFPKHHHLTQQQQHGIEGRIIVMENNLSKTKQQQQPATVVQLYHPEQQQELIKTKLNSSPFTIFNKIPGHFTPIIYTNQGNNNINQETSQQEYNLVNGDGSGIIRGSSENDNIEGHKPKEHIYKIQQQQHQLNKEQQQYYQYHHLHNHPQQHQHQQQQQEQPEGNQNEQQINEQDVLLTGSVGQQSQQLEQHHKHVGIVSSTQRPHFQIVTGPPLQLQPTQKYHYPQETSYNKKPESSLTEEESLRNLTPQQKYVEYLQRQLRNKQQIRNQNNHQQQQQQNKEQDSDNYHPQLDAEAYLINESPLSSIAPPDNHINYQENPPPTSQNHHRHHQYIYRPQSTKHIHNQDKQLVYVEENERNHPLISDTVQQTNQHNTQTHKYVEYINIPEKQHRQPHIPQQVSSTISTSTTSSLIIPPAPQQKDNNIFKPIVFVTTAATPILLTSIPSNYKYHQQQHLHPIFVNPSEKPLINNTHSYNNNQHKSPIFIVKPKLYLSKTNQQIQPIRQHLTEITQLPAPILSSYRTNSSNNRNNNNGHYYNRYYHKTSTTSLPSTSSEIPLKLRPSQKFQPIVVTTLQPTLNLLKHDDIEESQSLSVIPKYEKQQPTAIHKQTLQSSGERPQQQQSYHHNSDTINNFPEIKSSSLAEILRKLQDSNHLPQTITPNNIDNSIKTLIKILNNLKESQTINENPPQHHDDDYRDYDDTPVDNPDPSHRGPNSGRPGIDYPALYEIPQTNFNCKEQRYKGFFGDPETNCQVWHYCDLNGGQASFLCPNGTIFSQVALTCDWWFNVKCSSTAQLYVLNERLYKYILPFTPKFPEDYSGPLVDKYLALKFKEMEEKMTREKLKGREKTEEYNGNDSKTKETDEKNSNIKNVSKTNDHDGDDEDISKEIDERSNATENQEIKSINLVDVEENRGSVDTGITYNTVSTSTENSFTLKPIVVSSTTIDPPIIYQSPQPTPFMLQSSSMRPEHNSKSKNRHYHHKKQQKTEVSVESEQVELIEIKTDGSSGHIVPSNPEY